MARRRDAEVVAQLLVDVDERWRQGDTVTDGEAQAVCLAGAVVGVLPEDDHAGVGVRRQVEGGEHLVGRRVDPVVLAFGAHERLQVDQYGLANSARSTGFQSVFAATPPFYSPATPHTACAATPHRCVAGSARACCGDRRRRSAGQCSAGALATLPTALERGPELPGGARLWVKRDDLTGLGAGGNKARKLEFLCAEAVAAGARSLVTVGAAQSNHCRMTAAAGARLGLGVHLVLAGDRPERFEGNLVGRLFGAQLHFVGCPDHHWGELEIAREQVTAELAADGQTPHSIPIGGSTATGALGYVAAYAELLDQCAAASIAPRAIVFTSSSGGTHAGLVAGRALLRSPVGRMPRPCWRSALPKASSPAIPMSPPWRGRRSR